MILSDRPETSQSKKVALEDLLRLKRVERPDPQFWARFEEDLRTKQLAAIVARRPWWHLNFSGFVRTMSRFRVPLGAAAVVTLSFATYREYRNFSTTGQLAGADSTVNTDIAGIEPVLEMVDGVVRIGPVTLVQPETVVAASEKPQQAPAPAVDSSRSVNGGMIPFVGDAALVSAAIAASRPSALTASLVATKGADSDLDEKLPVAGRSLARTVSMRSNDSIDPLSDVASSVAIRKTWITTYVSGLDSDRPHRAVDPDRMNGRLNEDQLYNKFGRVGMGKGGVNLSF